MWCTIDVGGTGVCGAPFDVGGTAICDAPFGVSGAES